VKRVINALFALLFGAFISPLVGFVFPKGSRHFTPLVTFVSFAIVLSYFNSPGLITNVLWKAPPIGIFIEVDGFNYLMLLLATGLGFLTALFASEYMRESPRLTHYNTLYLLMLTGIVGVIITGDLFNLYVFFEIASISSYALVAYHASKGALRATTRYLIVGSLGTTLVFLGIILVYSVTGSLNMADIAIKMSSIDSPLLYVALAFFFIGFGIKADLVPFHAWKPGALSLAPSPAASLFAGGSVVMSLYAIFRIFFTIFLYRPFYFTYIFQFFAVFTMLVGAFLAFRQDDMKKLIAFSGISQVGYVFLAVSFSTPAGLFAGLFQMVNLVVSEVLLFLCAGLVARHVGSKKMDSMSGLFTTLPLASVGILVGAGNIIGIPPFSGFASKILLYQAGFDSGFLVVTLISLVVSAMTLGYFLKPIFSLSGERRQYEAVDERKPQIFIPLASLVVLCLLLGFFPQLIYPLLNRASLALMDPTAYLGVLR